MSKLKAVSLFCGCGGTDVGLKGDFQFLGQHYASNDIDIIFANDIEPKAIEILEKNFTCPTFVGDIKQLDHSLIPEHDLLTGGFPCQSFSIVAQNPPRLGIKDEKGELFFEMCKVLKEKKPSVFIAENVKGILSANNKKAFPLILEEFKKSGYYVTWKLLNSVDFGVPQKRERVFIVGFKSERHFNNFKFPILNNIKKATLADVIFPECDIDAKYYFSERAVQGLLNSNKKMNKGRAQDVDQPCNTVGAHLAKVSLNSTDPVLCIDGKYRRFTPREVARIQSFPDSFKLVGSDSSQYKALGNAIPPVMFWHLVQEIKIALNIDITPLKKVV
ncbi:DNA (cytosine-5-)-methyltransferase [Providencia rettgeri]|uniref:DNA cytosine methyltransferase n=1 Tax=Providencia rettgeri TaxID=587 RepID=UPI001EE73379|nr:DNA (cytosine-5-)-methyltransferase [Providencia rettgeri]MCG5371214.1 DNA (cytosine-5-)-methyltransferase [Providencia rettgeri]